MREEREEGRGGAGTGRARAASRPPIVHSPRSPIVNCSVHCSVHCSAPPGCRSWGRIFSLPRFHCCSLCKSWRHLSSPTQNAFRILSRTFHPHPIYCCTGGICAPRRRQVFRILSRMRRRLRPSCRTVCTRRIQLRVPAPAFEQQASRISCRIFFLPESLCCRWCI